MTNDTGQLGILDWGIGGLSVYRQIKLRRANAAVVYFSDTGATPYGRMTRAALAARLHRVIDFLKARGVTHLVIGCNAASTAIDDLARRDVVIEGVIESAVELAAGARPRRLAVLGGRRTVLSGIYRRKLAARGVAVEQRIAQPLSALIERGDISSDELRAAGRKILAPVKNASHVLLACTHYPAIAEVLREFVAPATVFLDPAEALAARLDGRPPMKAGADVFDTTGDPAAMRTAAARAFGVEIEAVETAAP